MNQALLSAKPLEALEVQLEAPAARHRHASLACGRGTLAQGVVGGAVACALNALRRTEPLKASRLWYDKYLLDLRRFNDEAGPVAALLGAVLDSRRACHALTTVAALGIAFVARRPVGFAVIKLLTSQLCWKNYAVWSPIVHAPLPLKLLILRQAYITAVNNFRSLELQIRAGLVELESRVLEAGVREDLELD